MSTTSGDDTSSNRPADAEGQQPAGNVPTNANEVAVTQVAGTADEDLPEWEPLTPELVEDEAIRGDFVMRWAVVGLAILLGCSQIAETKTLLHIRSGEYLATHGVLPPAKDYLSYTRAELPWVNLSWLFDLVTAGVHGLGGGIGLTLFQTLLAAVTFGLIVQTVRPGIRTWWGSICAALALLACFRQFTMQTELITLLGVATTLWWLTATQEGQQTKFQWAIMPVIWLWSQLDPQAYWGWGLLLLYGVGEAVGGALGRPGFADSSRRKQFWLVTGACVIAAAIHPWTWHVWVSPTTVYGAEYPGLRATFTAASRGELGAFSILHERYYQNLNFEGGAAGYLACAALATLLLNHQRARLSHAFLFVGVNALPFLASHDLAAASLVNCVLATLNAQEWYLARYGQRYSIQPLFLLFSRGGRAVTVVALFALACLIISGRIDGANGKRTGWGFDPQLQTLMDGYTAAFADSYDDRPFPFVLKQGDLMIWAGQRSFVDSRCELYFPGGEDSLLNRHVQTRAALRQKTADLPGSGQPKVWRSTFETYQITHVAPRMSGLTSSPNYRTFDDLLRSANWKLTTLNSAVAVFYRADQPRDKQLKAYLESHRFDLAQQAFRDDTPPATEPQVWPAVTTAYQQMLSLTKPNVPGEAAEATHYVHFATQDNLKFPQRFGALHLGIRSARAGLRKDPNSAAAYKSLGAAYSLLDQMENMDLRRFGVGLPHLLRYYQIAAAYQSALLLEPNDPFLNQEVAGFYLRLEKGDLALRHLNEVIRLRPATRPDLEEQAARQLEEVAKLTEQLESRLSQVQGEVDKQLDRGSPRLNVAMWAYQNGAVLAAIQVLDADKVALVQNPQAQVSLAGWLMEAGRVEEADQMIRTLERQFPGVDSLPGFRDNAMYAAWAQADYERVAKLLEDAISTGERRRVGAALGTGPLTSIPSPLIPAERYPWMHSAAMEEIEGVRPTELGTHLIHLAICRLEQGDIPAAKSALQRIIDDAPQTLWRPLLLSYWYCLTGEFLDIEPPSDWIPITKDLFAVDDGPSE